MEHDASYSFPPHRITSNLRWIALFCWREYHKKYPWRPWPIRIEYGSGPDLTYFEVFDSVLGEQILSPIVIKISTEVATLDDITEFQWRVLDCVIEVTEALGWVNSGRDLMNYEYLAETIPVVPQPAQSRSKDQY